MHVIGRLCGLRGRPIFLRGLAGRNPGKGRRSRRGRSEAAKEGRAQKTSGDAIGQIISSNGMKRKLTQEKSGKVGSIQKIEITDTTHFILVILVYVMPFLNNLIHLQTSSRGGEEFTKSKHRRARKRFKLAGTTHLAILWAFSRLLDFWGDYCNV
jgi:hypothetical protein